MSRLLDVVRSRSPEEWAQLARELHARGGGLESLAGGGPQDVYERARRHFARKEEELLQERSVTDAVVDGLRKEASRPVSAPPQLAVALQAEEGGVARGRFVLDNPTAARRELTFRPSELRGASGVATWVPFRLVPARLSLAPGERATLAIELDLADTPPLGGTAELDVEVQQGGRVVALVWLTLRLLARGE